MRPKLIIFRYELLPSSETFIASQAASLRSFQPRYAGIQRVQNSLPIPEDSIVLMKDDGFSERIKRRIFLHTGWAPSFYKKLRAEQPALIHAHFAPDGAIALPLVSELRVPLVVTLHGFDVASSKEFLLKDFSGRLYFKRKQRLLQTAKLFICVSKFIRQRAIEAGFPASKLRVHYIGVDRTLFAPSTQLRQPNLILFVGRLVEQKGCRALIEAMARVQQSCHQAKLVVIGDGPDRPAFEALAQEARISCEFLGTQPGHVVRDWMARSQVFCGPSITGPNGAREGLGMVFAEAQATGLPVVSFKTGGIPEIVRHGETGLLAPEGDCELLADYLLRYLTDAAFWQACSRRATEWIQRSFDLHQQTRGLESIYSEAIGTEVTDATPVIFERQAHHYRDAQCLRNRTQ